MNNKIVRGHSILLSTELTYSLFENTSGIFFRAAKNHIFQYMRNPRDTIDSQLPPTLYQTKENMTGA